MMSALYFLAVGYLAITALCAAIQAIENRTASPGDRYWAPVWWIALTWPYWVVVTLIRGPR